MSGAVLRLTIRAFGCELIDLEITDSTDTEPDRPQFGFIGSTHDLSDDRMLDNIETGRQR